MALNILFYEMKIHKPTEQDLTSLNLAFSLIIFTLYAIQLGSMIKLNVQKLNPIFFYSNDNTIFNNNNEYKNSTIKVDQFWRNGEWNIFIWKNIKFLQWIQVFLESHYTITVIWIFTYIQIWVLTYLKTDGFIFLTFHQRIMTIFTTIRFCSRNCICFV